MKLSDYVAAFLAQYTRHVFVGNGGCIVHLLDSIDRTPNLRNIPCQNEQGAAIAAEAYSRVTRKMGVAVATSGPGMVNLIQGIACAYFDSIPTLYISGASPTGQLKGSQPVRQMGFQEMEVVGVVKPITKYAVLVTDPKRIKYELQKLAYVARQGRPGPVMLDLPDDLQRAEIDPDRLEGFVPADKPPALDESQIDEVLELIAQAQRPVVVVGGGVKLGQAESLTKEFLDKSGIPYATTWATIDMFLDDEPNLTGNFGVSANRAGNFAIQNSDLIICLASRLDTHQTGSNAARFAPKAKKVVIDIDGAEIDKVNGMTIDVKINCDVGAFLERINSCKIGTMDLDSWRHSIRQWRRRYPVCLPEYYSQSQNVNPYVFMNELSRASADGDIVITDAGGTLTWTMQGYKIRSRQMLFSAFNHSPMGYAFPAAIGAQFAAPQRRVVCITGDGGMQMNVQELETVAYYALPIKIFLINNGEYGIIKQTQDTWLDSRYVASDPGSGLGFPDYQKVAKAYGVAVAEIDNHARLEQVIRDVLAADEPVLCDVKVGHGQKIVPKLEFGRPIEDLSPFLPREELKANMLV